MFLIIYLMQGIPLGEGADCELLAGAEMCELYELAGWEG